MKLKNRVALITGAGSSIGKEDAFLFAREGAQEAYCVSKAGIVSYTQCMALELAPFDIQVNCICPGFTDTPMFRSFFTKWFPDNEEKDKVIQDTETKAARFLVSDDASFITGQALVMDDGTTINIF
jgi:NAD(P)-dependent dehydrogenase (short-subunit alcohol dehydrogenase family)